MESVYAFISKSSGIRQHLQYYVELKTIYAVFLFNEFLSNQELLLDVYLV